MSSSPKLIVIWNVRSTGLGLGLADAGRPRHVLIGLDHRVERLAGFVHAAVDDRQPLFEQDGRDHLDPLRRGGGGVPLEGERLLGAPVNRVFRDLIELRVRMPKSSSTSGHRRTFITSSRASLSILASSKPSGISAMHAPVLRPGRGQLCAEMVNDVLMINCYMPAWPLIRSGRPISCRSCRRRRWKPTCATATRQVRRARPARTGRPAARRLHQQSIRDIPQPPQYRFRLVEPPAGGVADLQRSVLPH